MKACESPLHKVVVALAVRHISTYPPLATHLVQILEVCIWSKIQHLIKKRKSLMKAFPLRFMAYEYITDIGILCKYGKTLQLLTSSFHNALCCFILHCYSSLEASNVTTDDKKI